MRHDSLLLGMAAAAAVGGASFSALAGPCTTADLSTYFSGGSNATCTVLDKTISGMWYTNPGNVQPLPGNGFIVTPVLVTNDPGLTFTLGFFNTIPASISYTITAPSTGPMTDASLAITATVQNGNTSGVTESLSNGKTLSASDSNLNPTPITFTAATGLNVTDVVSASGTASVDTIENRFSETPAAAVSEPSSLVLLGIGLPALGVVRRRRKHS